MSLISTLLRTRATTRTHDHHARQLDEARNDKEMSFLDHLEELRWHLIRSIVAIAVGAVVIFVYRAWVYDAIITAPLHAEFPLYKFLCQLGPDFCFKPTNIKIQANYTYEQFTASMVIALVGGFVVAFPVVAWEIWRFIRPALSKAERRRLRGTVGVISGLFFAGVLFSYYVVTPFSVQFLATFTLSESISNEWKIGSIVGLVAQVTVGGGLIFQMPTLAYYLGKVGLLTPVFMRRYRRHAIVVLLIVAALITPPDVISQIAIFLPLALLYEVSIWVCAIANRPERAPAPAAQAAPSAASTPAAPAPGQQQAPPSA